MSKNVLRRFFTTSEVAKYCAVTNDGVLKWIKSSKLRAHSTPGGHYRISAEDFRLFLNRFDIPVDEAFFRIDAMPVVMLISSGSTAVNGIGKLLLEEARSFQLVQHIGLGYDAAVVVGCERPRLILIDVDRHEIERCQQFVLTVKEHIPTTHVIAIIPNDIPTHDSRFDKCDRRITRMVSIQEIAGIVGRDLLAAVS